MNYALWIIQVLLALLFLFAGGVKLVMPLEEMTKQIALPGLFLRFIAVAEILGALGLILPGLLNIRPRLTSLAAAGLVIIMIGATVTTLMTMGLLMSLFPLVVGLLAAFVAYNRWTGEKSRRRGLLCSERHAHAVQHGLQQEDLLQVTRSRIQIFSAGHGNRAAEARLGGQLSRLRCILGACRHCPGRENLLL